MTASERVRTAMDLGTPDRVPFMCQLSIGHMLLNLGVSPVEFWCDKATFSDGLHRLRAMYDFDGILVSLHGHDPSWRSNVRETQPTPEGDLVEWANGDRTLFPFDELPRHHPAVVHQPPSLQKLAEADLPVHLDYIPVSQGLRFPIHRGHKFDVIADLVRSVGTRYSVHGEVTSPLDYYLDLFGLEDGLMGLIEFPAQAERALSRFADLVAELAGEMARTGVDAIKVSSPYAGAGFLSRTLYTNLVLPYEQKIARTVRDAGVHVYTHTCGAIGDRLELLFDAGVSGIECLDPPPLGNVELAEAKARTRGKGFIKGNVDSVHTLLNNTPERILADAKERLLVGKEGGGFIFSTACSVAPGVPREHVMLLRDAVERWGGGNT
jgi:hypothetical protein